ncbi:hypothetical protein FACS1894170_10020 [Planctomycetales bacterium]|nr:hypothetical protein FACS1894170_10020 [Planctomycetales bacterium]
MLILCFALGISTSLLAVETSAPTDSYPVERIGFWTSINKSLTRLKFDETLEKLKTFDEFSDENGLTFYEFRSYIVIKCACLMEKGNKAAAIEYLDKLADYTRKSKRWKNEIFATENLFALYYAFLGEFKKAEKSIARYIDLMDEQKSEWLRYNSPWHAFVAHYHAACIYAANEKYDKAIKICDDWLMLDIDSDPVYSKNIEVVEEFYARLKQNGIERDLFRALMDEYRNKRQNFVEKKGWTYKCKVAYVSDDGPDNTSNKVCQFGIFLQWSAKKKATATAKSPHFEVLRLYLPPVGVLVQEF